MIDSQLTLTTTLMLLGTASLIILVAYFSANFTFHKLSSKNKGQIVKIVVGIVFGLLAIYGTVMATKLPDGIAPNVRELAAMMAGIAGGPIAGTLAGFIGGV